MRKSIVFAVACVLACGATAWGQSAGDSFFGDAPRYRQVKVAEVTAADIFVLEDGETIRLIGLRAPEGPRRRKDVERDKFGFVVEEEADPVVPVEEQAFAFARELAQGKTVRLEFDVEKKDARFRTLAYVFLVGEDGEEIFVNAEILRQGFADLHLQPPNMTYAARLREAYTDARRERRGLQGK